VQTRAEGMGSTLFGSPQRVLSVPPRAYRGKHECGDASQPAEMRCSSDQMFKCGVPRMKQRSQAAGSVKTSNLSFAFLPRADTLQSDGRITRYRVDTFAVDADDDPTCAWAIADT